MISHGTECSPRIQYPRAPIDLQYSRSTAMLLPLTMKHPEAHWLVSSTQNRPPANRTLMRVSASLLGAHIGVG